MSAAKAAEFQWKSWGQGATLQLGEAEKESEVPPHGRIDFIHSRFRHKGTSESCHPVLGTGTQQGHIPIPVPWGSQSRLEAQGRGHWCPSHSPTSTPHPPPARECWGSGKAQGRSP